MASEDQQISLSNRQRPHSQQGVLWKRRDVFKNKWRPRWFVLQPEEAVLTYYLLSKTDSTAPTTISTPLRRPNNATDQDNSAFPTSAAVHQQANPSVHPTVSEQATDNATVSDNTVDYDVVPRGAIYLAGCRVFINDKLSLPQEGLFAFTVVPPNNSETECHLAARNQEARAAWVATLSVACSNGMGNNGNNNNGAVQNNCGRETRESSWKSLSPREKLFENVPDPLAAKLEQCLENHLELCEDLAPAQWTPIFQDRDGVSAFQRQDLHGRVMMKSTAIVPHHPKQLLNLLLDTGRRQDYETNIAASIRLELLSHHTFYDYYAFKAVWPTSPRDFAVVTHWQTLCRQLAEDKTEEALVLLAFSCPEAESLKAPTAPHVRASLHGSFYLLRLISPLTNSDQSATKCHMTRILAYDLGGSLPRNLATTVLMQQAGMPGILSKHLKRVEPTPEPRMSTHEGGPLDNEGVITDIVESITKQDKSAMVSSARRRLNFDKSFQEKDSSDSIGIPQLTTESKGLSKPTTVVILLMPLLLHSLATAKSLSSASQTFEFWFFHPSIIFLAAALVGSRLFALSLLGPEVPNASLLRTYQGTLTFMVNVDLKGVLRFIRMKKEEKGELAIATSKPTSRSAPAEVSVVHIVAIALARALQNHADCWNYRRVRLPFLWVDSFFRYTSSTIDLSLSLACGRLVCLEDFACDNVQAVANAMSAAEHGQAAEKFGLKGIVSSFCSFMDLGHRHGRCLILLTKNDSEDDHKFSNDCDAGCVEITTAIPPDIDVLVTVGGVRLQRSNPSVGSPLRTSTPKPFLSLSVAINSASLLHMSKCHAFVEDLAKLIQFPEICDE